MFKFLYLSEVICSFFSEDLSLLNRHDSLFLGNIWRGNALQDEKYFPSGTKDFVTSSSLKNAPSHPKIDLKLD